MKIIYDLGCNKGQNLAYYLSKADKVVAVEANPALIEQIKNQFQSDIESGKLVLEHCVLTVCNKSEVNFYICDDPVRSRMGKPSEDDGRYHETTVPAKNIIQLINEHGKPYYIKIDIEFYDHILLKHLFENGIRPPYISSESHTIEVFCLMVVLGQYNKFKLVEGCDVHAQYAFENHSAGPFGEDIHGEWMDKDQFFNLLAEHKLGWKDIHATSHTPHKDSPEHDPY